MNLVGTPLALLMSFVSLGWQIGKDLNDRSEVIEVRPTRIPAGFDVEAEYSKMGDPHLLEFFDIVNLGERPVHLRSLRPWDLILMGSNREVPPGGYVTVRTGLKDRREEMAIRPDGSEIVVHTTRGTHYSGVRTTGRPTWNGIVDAGAHVPPKMVEEVRTRR